MLVDLYTSHYNSLQVVDLLIAMANAAANSPRANLILDPYPSLVDPDNPHRLAMDPKVYCCSAMTNQHSFNRCHTHCADACVHCALLM